MQNEFCGSLISTPSWLSNGNEIYIDLGWSATHKNIHIRKLSKTMFDRDFICQEYVSIPLDEFPNVVNIFARLQKVLTFT